MTPTRSRAPILFLLAVLMAMGFAAAIAPHAAAVDVPKFLVGDDEGCIDTEILVDAGCWALTSGGLGEAGVPDSDDTAILDANSGSDVYTTGNDCETTGAYSFAGFTALVGFAGTITVDFPLTGDCLELTGNTVWAAGSWNVVSQEVVFVTEGASLTMTGGDITVLSGGSLKGGNSDNSFILASPGGTVILEAPGSRFAWNVITIAAGTVTNECTALTGQACFSVFGNNDPVTLDITYPGIFVSNGLSITNFTATGFNGAGSALNFRPFVAFDPPNDSVSWRMEIGNDGDLVNITIGSLTPLSEYRLFRDGSPVDTSTSDALGEVTFNFAGVDQTTHLYALVVTPTLAPSFCDGAIAGLDLTLLFLILIGAAILLAIFYGLWAWKEGGGEAMTAERTSAYIGVIIAVVVVIAVSAGLVPFLAACGG